MRSITHSLLAATAVAFVATAGCGSFSKSSESSSTIISSPFTSSSASSSPEQAYQDDLRDYTAAYMKAGGRIDNFQREVAKIAQKHGVTNWEQNKSTYRGIGAGLRKAGATQVEVDAFKHSLTTTPEQAQWLQDAYE